MPQKESVFESPKYRITYGGWYQRTTLHLSELYEFFLNANTKLPLDKNNLSKLRENLGIISVDRFLGNLEYIDIKTTEKINIKYYEDGLFTLSMDDTEVEISREILDQYYETKLKPAVNYLFSLGAPTPKIIANIKNIHPVAVTCFKSPKQMINVDDLNWLTDVYSVTEVPHIKVIKSRKYILVVVDTNYEDHAEEIVNMQIFFREFKDQLERYLNIHRNIWIEISEIKESKKIKTKDLEAIRQKLDSYLKTISLISNRINQMASYVKTRKAIAQKTEIDEQLTTLFQYRFEVLLDTLDYIKEIWKMTLDYTNSNIQIVVEAQAAATAKGIQSLTLITSIGVIAGLMTHLSRDQFPKVTQIGIYYFIGLLTLGWFINFTIQLISQNRRLKLKFFDQKLR